MRLQHQLCSIAAVAFFMFSALAGAAGNAPVISGTPPSRVIAGHPYFFEATATDAENNNLTYTIRNKPQWATFWRGSGRLFGTPTGGNVRTYYNIVIEVSDGTSTAALQSFSIAVDPAGVANQRPTISGTPGDSVEPGNWFGFQPQAQDPDGHSLTYTIGNRPSWATFNVFTGQLYGRPSAGDIGNYQDIGLWVTDGQKTNRLPAFNVRVAGTPPSSGGNTPPTISGIPPRAVVVGNTWSLKVAAADADGDSLTYSIANKPPWANFQASNGRLSGQPGTAHIGWHGAIGISVSDGQSTVNLPAFAVRVDSAGTSNAPPVIGGTPATSVGPTSWYKFEPQASDANGHALNFSIQNKPAWAGFDAMTGKLYGRPGLGNIGSYNDIRISVTDGIATRTLSPFSILVGNAGSGSLTLSWTPPTLNTDGSQLTDLASYRIHYGTSSGVYTKVINLGNAGLTTYVIDSLLPATYYLVLTAINAQGVESNYSGQVQKTVN